MNIDQIIHDFTYKYLYKEVDKEDILGIILSGSYARNLQNSYSDLDLHIIVRDSCAYRKRGNIKINGLLVEYNVNPFKQMIKYFEIEKLHNVPFRCTAVLEGKTIFEKQKAVTKLKTIAKEWLRKDYPRLKNTLAEFNKYQIADNLHKMISLYNQQSKVFVFSYFNNIKFIYDFYAKYLGQPILKDYMLYDYFSTNTRYKGILDEFPDREFAAIFLEAMLADTNETKLEQYEKLSEYVLANSGGFELNGWKFELPVDYTNKMDVKTREF